MRKNGTICGRDQLHQARERSDPVVETREVNHSAHKILQNLTRRSEKAKRNADHDGVVPFNSVIAFYNLREIHEKHIIFALFIALFMYNI